MSETVERVARAICKAQGIEPDDTAGFATFRYDERYPGGSMQVGRYEQGWQWDDRSKLPRSPNGTKAWQWFVGEARAAIDAIHGEVR